MNKLQRDISYHYSVSQGKYMPNAMKGNAEK